MPRFFFDIHDSGPQWDDTGTELASVEEVRDQARRILPDLARDETPGERDQKIYTVLVTDEEGHPVYSATLSYVGQWLRR